jgi:hypothetical protein
MVKKNLPEENYISYCLFKVEDKLGWHESSNWRHRDFVKLSEMIYDDTKYRISLTTLKRIWGKVHYTGNVGPTTLDALSTFLGYTDWMDFKIKNQIEVEELAEDEQKGYLKQTIITSNKKRVKKINHIFIIILLVFCVVAGLFFVLKRTNKPVKDYSVYNFTTYNPKGTVPYAVKFSFDVSNILADSIFIKAGDGGRKHYIKPDDNFLTRMYFTPGAQKAVLMADNVVLQEIDLFAGTDGWLGLIKRPETTHPIYFREDSIIQMNRLYISPQELKKGQINTSQAFFVNFYYVKHFNIDGDDFSFRVRIRNNVSEGGDVCQKTNVGILSSNSFMVIPLINEGCIALAKLFISDTYVNGWTNDLSDFARDMDQWQEVYVRTKNKKAKIYINDEMIREINYDKPMGEVIGFRIEFQGCGSIDFVELFDQENQKVFSEDFGGRN